MGASGSKGINLQLSPAAQSCLESGNVNMGLLREVGSALECKSVPDDMTYAQFLLWMNEHTHVDVKAISRTLKPYIDLPMGTDPHDRTPLRMICFDANEYLKRSPFDTPATRVFQQLLAYKTIQSWLLTVNCDTDGNATSRFLSRPIPCSRIVTAFEKLGGKRRVRMRIKMVSDMRTSDGASNDARHGACEFLIWRANDPYVEKFAQDMSVNDEPFSEAYRNIVNMPQDVCPMFVDESTTDEIIRAIARPVRGFEREDVMIAYDDDDGEAMVIRDEGPNVVVSCARATTGSVVQKKLSEAMNLKGRADPILKLIGYRVDVVTTNARAPLEDAVY